MRGACGPKRWLRRRTLFVSCHREFLHLEQKPVSDEASAVGIPSIAVKAANPLGIWVPVLADVDRARSPAVRVAAVVMFHLGSEQVLANLTCR